MAMRLSKTQALALRRAPLDGAKNKVSIALSLLEPPGTQAQLADEADVSVNDLSAIRNGKYKRISLDICQRISRVLGVCTDDVFPRETHVGSRAATAKARSKAQRAKGHRVLKARAA